MRVLYPVKRTYWFDIYKNIDKIGAVNCQVLVIHVSITSIVSSPSWGQLMKWLIVPMVNSFGSFARISTILYG
ncbi:hypothetical protein Gorai_019005 [Gossypium raimondii]|uniref:Uncharacterized protein n=1 Tax=Gossypium raimondii TaxID=29730 RepID=A0A7J8PN48_GOSRA|nr:hypothetical protein [Gossypium raimondii]